MKMIKIDKLGNKLVSCRLNCEGINNNAKKGIIPRCLIVEERIGKKNCIVVGLNPGKCKKGERQYYIDHGFSYQSIKDYFEDSGLKGRAYFRRTRDIILELGYDGNILWTDLVKCECLKGIAEPPVHTLRVCINKFLRHEVKLFKSLTIFALGKVAFNFCALSFPEYFIVGLPHPTGPYSNKAFNDLQKRIVKSRRVFIKELSKQVDGHGHYRALRLKA